MDFGNTKQQKGLLLVNPKTNLKSAEEFLITKYINARMGRVTLKPDKEFLIKKQTSKKITNNKKARIHLAFSILRKLTLHLSA